MKRSTLIFSFFFLLLAGSAFLPKTVRAVVGQECLSSPSREGDIDLRCDGGEICGNVGADNHGTCFNTCILPDDGSHACTEVETCVVASATDDPELGACVPEGASTNSTGTPGTVDSTTDSGNLGTAKSGNYGLGALTGTNLYKGTPETIVINIVRQVFFFIGLLLVVLIVYGGILYMTSIGNETRVKTAKGIITAAIVGAIIVFAAYLIAELVIRALSTP